MQLEDPALHCASSTRRNEATKEWKIKVMLEYMMLRLNEMPRSKSKVHRDHNFTPCLSVKDCTDDVWYDKAEGELMDCTVHHKLGVGLIARFALEINMHYGSLSFALRLTHRWLICLKEPKNAMSGVAL